MHLRPPREKLQRVLVPRTKDNATTWHRVQARKEMEDALFHRNRNHFKQAKTDKTPFTTEPMTSPLGFHAETEFANLTRSGEANLEDLDVDEDARTFLTELMPSPTDPQEISATLQTKDVMKAC